MGFSLEPCNPSTNHCDAVCFDGVYTKNHQPIKDYTANSDKNLSDWWTLNTPNSEILWNEGAKGTREDSGMRGGGLSHLSGTVEILHQISVIGPPFPCQRVQISGHLVEAWGNGGAQTRSYFLCVERERERVAVNALRRQPPGIGEKGDITQPLPEMFCCPLSWKEMDFSKWPTMRQHCFNCSLYSIRVGRLFHIRNCQRKGCFEFMYCDKDNKTWGQLQDGCQQKPIAVLDTCHYWYTIPVIVTA